MSGLECRSTPVPAPSDFRSACALVACLCAMIERFKGYHRITGRRLSPARMPARACGASLRATRTVVNARAVRPTAPRRPSAAGPTSPCFQRTGAACPAESIMAIIFKILEHPCATLAAGNIEMKGNIEKISLAIILVTLAALFLSPFFQSSSEATPPPHPQAAGRKSRTSEQNAYAPRQAAPLETAIHPAIDPNTNPRPKEHRNALQWMQDARDYRVVLNRLAQAGTPEAGLYADYLLRHCYMIIRSGVQNAKTDSSQQDFARELLWSRCSSFSSDELTGQRMRELPDDTRFPDGLLQIRNEWNEAGQDIQKRKLILNQAFERKDPLLLEQIGPGLLMSETGKIQLAGTQFNGQNALAAARNAWISAACEGSGMACGPGDHYVVDACATTGICDNSRFETLRELTRRSHGPAYVRDFDSAHRIFLDAIRSGNPAILVSRLADR